jgi:hypothetical protein
MKNFFIKKFQATLSLAIQLILRHPQISQKINQFLLLFPSLHKKIFSFAQHRGIFAHHPSSSAEIFLTDTALTPKAYKIYSDLLSAREKEKRLQHENCD